MRLAVIADVHLANHRRHGGASVSGINERCRLALASLRRAIDLAVEDGCSALVVVGDLFDDDWPPPQVIAAAQDEFKQARDARVDVVVLAGNHDQRSVDTGDHALGPLREVAHVIDEPTVVQLADVDLWCVPYRPGPASEWLPAAVAQIAAVPGDPRLPSDRQRVLVLHAGLVDSETPPYLRAAPDGIGVETVVELTRKHGIETVFAGHWHSRRVWSTSGRIALVQKGVVEAPFVAQVGALVPTGHDNPGAYGYGTVAILDGRGCEIHEVAGPRFMSATSVADEAVASAHKAGHHVFLRVRAVPDKMNDAVIAAEAARAAGRIGGFEVDPDDGEARAAVRVAASAARSAETLDEAVSGFVREMPIPSGVDRDAVLAHARKYLTHTEEAI